ncbi:MAG: hypothetical protein H0W50_05785 [Parachlamydiaceae bacterium]|nr:hypothetical protein [Parachlamydiaceae bacterium]
MSIKPSFISSSTNTPASPKEESFNSIDIKTKSAEMYGNHQLKVQTPSSGSPQQIDILSKKILEKTPEKTNIPSLIYTPTHEKATGIAKQIEFDPRLMNLSSKQKQNIVDDCIRSYQESVEIFESTLGVMAAEHPDAKEFAQEMLNRIGAIAKAYQEIKVEEDKTSSPVMKELKIRLGTAAQFATYGDGTGAGSIGFNPISIEKCMKDGNLREQMLLIYATLWTTLPPIFADPTIIGKINEKLEKENRGFQLDKEALNAKMEMAKEGESPATTFFAQAKPLVDFRAAGGRIFDENRVREAAPKIKDLKDLSISEARATLNTYISEEEFTAMKKGENKGHALGEHRVQWIRGKDLFRVDEKSDFFQNAVAMGGLPFVTGPSGTTDGYLNGIKYLNMHGSEEKATLALTGWMVRSGDHTFHEIKEATTWHGMAYNPGPDSFKNVYPDDPDFQKKLESSMQAKGKELPGHYLQNENQLQVAKKLGYIDQT